MLRRLRPIERVIPTTVSIVADSSLVTDSRRGVESVRRIGEVVVSYELHLHRCHVVAVSSSCWEGIVGKRVKGHVEQAQHVNSALLKWDKLLSRLVAAFLGLIPYRC